MSKKKRREHETARRVLEVGGLRLAVTGEDGKYYHTEHGSFRKLREDVRIVEQAAEQTENNIEEEEN